MRKLLPKKSKKMRVLEMLRMAGSSGVHSFVGARTISFRFAAYVGFLKNDGHIITSVREKMGDCYGVRYHLLERLEKLESADEGKQDRLL